MKEGQSSQFRKLGAGPWARFAELFARMSAVVGAADLAVAFVLSTLVVFMMAPGRGFQVPDWKEGDLATSAIKTPRPLDLPDDEATRSERARSSDRVPDVYDYDAQAVQAWVDRWKRAVHDARVAGSRTSIADVSQRLGVPVLPAEFKALDKLNFSTDVERSVNLVFGALWEQRIAATRFAANTSLEIVDLKTGKSSFAKVRGPESVLSLDDAKALVHKAMGPRAKTRDDAVRLPWDRWPEASRTAVAELLTRLVVPNLTPNRKETEARREKAMQSVRPSYRRMERGEIVIHEGQRITEADVAILERLRVDQNHVSGGEGRPFRVLFGAAFLWFLLFFVRRQFPQVLAKRKDALVVGAFFVFSLAILKLTLAFQVGVLGESRLPVPEAFLVFLIPVATPAMTLRLLVDAPLTVLFAVLHALAATLVVGPAGLFGLYVLVSCLVGQTFVARCRTRSALYAAGLWTALVCGVSAACLTAAWGGVLPFARALFEGGASTPLKDGFGETIAWAFLGGLLGGWMSSAMALVMTPILENILDYTTDLKLLELARMDHPLLRELVLKAPGTYHHSIIVGSLAEAGAEAVDANSLLARVGAYYHDIGKIGRAEYFIENQAGGRNPHDQTTSQLSAKIIISHVKEGRQLAETYKLGQALIDFIETHHGTSLVSYFYTKAKQEAAQPGSAISPEEISEAEFRYPGPKPRTKECAILALADSCEAATRSLVDPTPARLEGMVNKIITKAYSEGLLDEAKITLEEVHRVGRAFLRILLGIHHNRIQYPDQEKGLPPRSLAVVKGPTNR